MYDSSVKIAGPKIRKNDMNGKDHYCRWLIIHDVVLTYTDDSSKVKLK